MEFIVAKEEDGMQISALLRRHAVSMPNWAVNEALRKKDVRIDGKRISHDGIRVSKGQTIRAFFPARALKQTAGELTKVYEDEKILLVIKPAGLPCRNEEHPELGDSAENRVLKQFGPAVLCHRLDVQTGGLLLFARTEEMAESCFAAFEERTIHKYYQCIVKGCPSVPEATLISYLRKDAENSHVSITDMPRPGSVEIRTRYRVLESAENARLEVELLTGRTHQIRAHLSHIGHPILGDDKYGDRVLNRNLGLRRQLLFATRMEFACSGSLAYLNGKVFEITCPF